LALATIMATTYISADHAVVAHNLPWGQVGSSLLTSTVEKSVSLKVHQYASEADLEQAAGQTKIYGGFVASSNTLIISEAASLWAPAVMPAAYGRAALLGGYPDVGSHFWVLWPICAFIALAVALFAALLHNLVGAMGTLLTVIIVVFIGNPTTGGVNGVAFLPPFWQAVGVVLPPRNGLYLIRNTLYFGGNAITVPIIVLGISVVIGAALVTLFSWTNWPKGTNGAGTTGPGSFPPTRRSGPLRYHQAEVPRDGSAACRRLRLVKLGGHLPGAVVGRAWPGPARDTGPVAHGRGARGPAAPQGGRRGRDWAPRWTIRGALGGRGHGQRGALWGPFRAGVRAVAGKDHPQNQRQA
jgi:hypothetical protein